MGRTQNIDVVIAAHDRASKRLGMIGGAMKGLTRHIFNLRNVVAGGAIVAPFVMATKVFANFGDEVAKMAKRTGLTVETLSELRFVASQTGTEFASLEVAFRKMQRSIYDAGRGLSTQTEALTDLGLKYKDLQGLAPEEQFKILADRLGKVADDTKQAAIAQVLFGRAGTNLIPMFEAGAKGIAKLQEQARKLGLTMSAEDVRAAEELTDAMDALGKSVKMVLFKMGLGLAPGVQAFVEGIQDGMPVIRDFAEAVGKKLGNAIADLAKNLPGIMKNLKEMIATAKNVGVALLAAFATVKVTGALMALGGGITATIAGTTGLAGALGALAPALVSLGIVGGPIAILAAGFAGLYVWMEKSKAKMDEIAGSSEKFGRRLEKDRTARHLAEQAMENKDFAKAVEIRKQQYEDLKLAALSATGTEKTILEKSAQNARRGMWKAQGQQEAAEGRQEIEMYASKRVRDKWKDAGIQLGEAAAKAFGGTMKRIKDVVPFTDESKARWEKRSDAFASLIIPEGEFERNILGEGASDPLQNLAIEMSNELAKKIANKATGGPGGVPIEQTGRLAAFESRFMTRAPGAGVDPAKKTEEHTKKSADYLKTISEQLKEAARNGQDLTTLTIGVIP